MTNWRFRLRPIDPTGKSPKVCPSLRAKRFRLTRRANQSYQLAPSHPTRGALRTSRSVWWDAVDAELANDDRERSRTAKSCGPGAPMLAPSSQRRFRGLRAMVAKEPGHQGELEISRNTIAQGRPDCLR
jgi:hypothetical protein